MEDMYQDKTLSYPLYLFQTFRKKKFPLEGQPLMVVFFVDCRNFIVDWTKSKKWTRMNFLFNVDCYLKIP